MKASFRPLQTCVSLIVTAGVYLCLLVLVPTAANADGLIVEDARYRVLPPGAPVTAGFALLHNDSTATIIISGATSEQFDKVELHESVIESDVAKMREIEQLSIAPGHTLTLEPGGFHMMLMGVREELSPSQAVEVELQTSAGSVPLLLQPVSMANDNAHGSGHGDHAPAKAHQHHDQNQHSHGGSGNGG